MAWTIGRDVVFGPGYSVQFQGGTSFNTIGTTFWVDPISGDNANNGLSRANAVADVNTAYGLCTAEKNDVVLVVPGDTPTTLTTAITWSKDYTHLIGLGGDLELGSRCRVIGGATTDLTSLITFSGSGCIVKGIKFSNETDADADSGAVIVTGSHNYFENCQVSGVFRATPGARAGCYSLKVSGEENKFNRCYIGLDTIVRAAANCELWLASGATRNIFRECHFDSYSETSTKVLVQIDDGVDIWVKFIDCMFTNFSVNWAASISNAISDDASVTHNIYIAGAGTIFEGCTGVADTLTHIFSSLPAPNNGFGLGLNPAA